MQKRVSCVFTKALPVLVLAGWLTSTARADQLQQLQQENQQLRQRVDQLAGELDGIKALLRERGLPVGSAAPAARPVTSKLDIQLYGYIKLDAAYDDSRVNAGNFARWVESESFWANDEQFNMTANQTRLGMDIFGPGTEQLRTSGKVEIDFYGAGAGENKPDPMLRHAYLKADWPELKLSLLAGQASDIISPLVPNTVNYSVAWWQGNIGYRRPQLRLTKNLALGEQFGLELAGGLTRTISGRRFGFDQSTDPDTGADSGFPTLAGRAALSFPLGDKRQGSLGVSGHFGGEEVHATNLISRAHYKSWSANVDVRLPLANWLLLQAEGFVGENLDSYLGGIAQGINTTTGKEIGSLGGWAAATLTPHKDWQLNLGAGFDNPDNGDLNANSNPTKDARASNTLVFGNAFYSFTANLQVGLELSYLRTTYRSVADGEALREQLAVIYKF